MTDVLAPLFTPLVVLAALVVVVLAVLLDRRIGPGPRTAGPRDRDRPAPPGQERTPWELKAIEEQLLVARGLATAAAPRYELTVTVNRLLVAAGLTDVHPELPVTADEAQLATAITLIEDRLGLPPLARTERSAPYPRSDALVRSTSVAPGPDDERNDRR